MKSDDFWPQPLKITSWLVREFLQYGRFLQGRWPSKRQLQSTAENYYHSVNICVRLVLSMLIIYYSLWKWSNFRLWRARDLDLGSGHTAYRHASLVDIYLHVKFHWNRRNFFSTHTYCQLQSHVTHKLGQESKIWNYWNFGLQAEIFVWN